MKKIIYSILSILTVGLAGCEKFLELTPESEYSVASAYKTQNDFTQAIAGVYAVQQSMFSNNGSWLRGVIARSDETSLTVPFLDNLDQFIDNATNAWTTQTWNPHYRIINLSNLILDKIDAGAFTDTKLRDYIKGEAYMMRANSYWTLGMVFGGVPLIDKTLSINETKQIKRSTQDETFAFAAEDFKKAISLLPVEWAGTSKGRATKFAAEGMLARFYMFQSKFSLAKPLLADVIASGKYGMEENYRDCFIDSKDNGKERVWEIQFTGGLTGEGQGFSTGNLPEGFSNTAVMPFSGFSSFIKVSPGMYNAYEKGDVRRDLSILKGWTSNTGLKDTVTMFIIKYNHYSYTPKTQTDWANNIPVIRFTDVKMMYAEVLNEEGYVSSGDALAILNEVRKRAGLAPRTAADLPSQAAMREALRQERMVEFAFEGLRWMDLVRWKTAETTINKFLSTKLEGGGIYQMKPHQTIFAIPFSEISRYNDETILWQNPGY